MCVSTEVAQLDIGSRDVMRNDLFFSLPRDEKQPAPLALLSAAMSMTERRTPTRDENPPGTERKG